MAFGSIPSDDRGDVPPSHPVLRRFVRGQLGQQRPLWRRHHDRADPLPRATVSRPSRALRPGAYRRIDRRLEAVLRSKRRSGGQLAIWEAVYGPVGEDGYPKPLWDPMTGKIDHVVAGYMRDHGYDLRHYAQTHWPEIGPKLVDKLHLYCGD